eukprot:1154188-Pelagomonas_calceolata.AAC.5
MIKSQRPCPISQSYLLSAHAESMNDKELDTTQVKMLQEPSRVARLAKGSGRSAVEVLNLIEVCKNVPTLDDVPCHSAILCCLPAAYSAGQAKAARVDIAQVKSQKRKLA